jgi:pyrroloquinoline-quinone synthase
VSLLIKKVDEEIERQSLLKHPFYQMWSHGELTVEQLAGYSKEYFQVVKMVPKLVSNVARSAPSIAEREQIGENLQEEESHIEPWVKFAGAMGVSRAALESYAGSRLAVESAKELDRITGLSYIEGVAALYAYEQQLPKISRSKIEGLENRYGFKRGDATRYFELHEEADVRHAAVWREIIERSVDSEPSIMRGATASLAAQNRLLDAVLQTYCQ